MNSYRKPHYYYFTALIAFIGLFTLLMLWHTVISPSTRFPVALILIVSITPLLLPFRGFLKANKKSCVFMAYISLIYLLHGSAEAFVNTEERVYAMLETVFSLMLFLGITFYLRLSAKQPQTQ